jgi:hypothetical protein
VAQETDQGNIRASQVITGGVAFAFGIVAVVTYAAQADAPGTVLASALMFSGAALLAGGFIGFLFGIPRTLTSDDRVSTLDGTYDVALTGAPYRANTNLEQISDWLTKILVGIGLTQLGSIRTGAARLFGSMSPSLGGQSDSAAFAAALCLYFGVLGFLSGWLLTRLLLASALSAADRRALQQFLRAEQAEAAGDTEVARRLREQALTTINRAYPAAVRYEELRRTMPVGPERTAQLERIIQQGRSQARDFTPEQVRELFKTGEDGLRVYALGVMQGGDHLADPESIVDAIERSRSAFEQYHALVAAKQLPPDLGEAERHQLVTAVRRQRGEGGRIKPGSKRWALSEELFRLLGESG